MRPTARILLAALPVAALGLWLGTSPVRESAATAANPAASSESAAARRAAALEALTEADLAFGGSERLAAAFDQPPGLVRGRVTLPAAAPAHGTALSVRLRSALPTDDDERALEASPGEWFELEALPLGKYVLDASGGGWGTGPRLVELTAAAPVATLELEAHRQSILSGLAVGPDGLAVSGAVVSAAVLAERAVLPLPQRVVAGRDGTFELQVPGDLRAPLLLLVRSPELAPLLERFDELPSGRARLELESGGALRGAVCAAGGAPLAEAEVELRPLGGPAWHTPDDLDLRRGSTAADGTYVVTGIPRGDARVRASLAGYATFEQAITSDGASTARLDVELEPECALRVALTTRAGAAVPFAEVTLHAAGAPQRNRRRIEPGPEGTFEARSLPAGDYELGVVAPGFAATRAAVTLPRAEQLALSLDAEAIVRGEVWTSGYTSFRIRLKNLEGERVRAETFHQPRFSIGQVPAGDYEVTVVPDGAPEQTIGHVTVAPGETADLGVVAPNGGSALVATVIDAATGSPLSAQCTLVRREGGDFVRAAEIHTDRDGLVRFSELARGEYNVVVVPDRGASTQARDIFLPGRGTHDLGSIAIATGGVLDVLLLGEDGRPLAGESLSVLENSGTLRPATTGLDGRARLQDVAAGCCLVSVSILGTLRSIEHEVTDGRVNELTVDLREFSLVTWSARLVRDGAPVPDVPVLVNGGDGAWRSTTARTDASGWFSVDGVLPGLAVLEVYGLRPGPLPLHVPVELPSGGPLPTEVVLPAGGIEGRLEPARAGVRVVASLPAWEADDRPAYVRILGQELAATTTDAAGAFRLDGLPPGEYRVTAELDGRRETSVAEDVVVTGHGTATAVLLPETENGHGAAGR